MRVPTTHLQYLIWLKSKTVKIYSVVQSVKLLLALSIAILLISPLLLKMSLYVLGYWVGIHFYSMVPQFSTVYFVFSQI